MAKRITALLLVLAFAAGSILAAAPVYAADESYVRKAVVEAFNELLEELVFVSEDTMKNAPDAFAEEAAKYTLTKEEELMLANEIKRHITVNPEGAIGLSEIEEIRSMVESCYNMVVVEHRKAAAVKGFKFQGEVPSPWAKDKIVELIMEDKLPEKFRDKFTQGLTKEEFIELWAAFSCNLRYKSEFVQIMDPVITENTPEYLRAAYVAGLIDNTEGLSSKITREQAAVMYANSRQGKSYSFRGAADIYCHDIDAISMDALDAVGIITNSHLMKTYDGKFLPKKAYTREEAIIDMQNILSGRLRGMIPQYEPGIFAKDPLKTVIGKDFVYICYPEKGVSLDHILSELRMLMWNLILSGKHQRIDYGYSFIESFGPEYLIKFTFKKNRGYVSENSSHVAYTRRGYIAEPRELKDSEAPSLEALPDPEYQQLYKQVDEILKKLIKPNMTDEQKVTAFHDYIVQNMLYLGRPNVKLPKGVERPQGGLEPEAVMQSMKAKAGSYLHYAGLFDALCVRAGIPCYVVVGGTSSGGHAWNLVHVNGKWRHVDIAWDDPDSGSKINYNYFLKDKAFMIKSHKWTGLGYDMPEYDDSWKEIDGMKITSTDMFRKFVAGKAMDGISPIKVKVLNKNVDTSVDFIFHYRTSERYSVRYDPKQGLYILTRTR